MNLRPELREIARLAGKLPDAVMPPERKAALRTACKKEDLHAVARLVPGPGDALSWTDMDCARNPALHLRLVEMRQRLRTANERAVSELAHILASLSDDVPRETGLLAEAARAAKLAYAGAYEETIKTLDATMRAMRGDGESPMESRDRTTRADVRRKLWQARDIVYMLHGKPCRKED